jgi:hypothetical protein
MPSSINPNEVFSTKSKKLLVEIELHAPFVLVENILLFGN